MKDFRLNALCYIYIILWSLYSLQQLLMLRGIISQSIFIVLMAISFYSFFMVNLCYKTGPYLKWLNVMLLVLTIYGILVIIGGETFHRSAYSSNVINNYIYLQEIYKSVLPIFGFYYFAMRRQINSKNLNLIFFVFLICSILLFYQNYIVKTEFSGKEEITNNKGYAFVPLIIMLYFVKMKDIWKYLLLAVILGYIMMAMKRGAILAGVVMLLLFLAHHLKVKSVTRLFSILIMSVVTIYLIFRVVVGLYANSDYFQQRLSRTMSGDSSGRFDIYMNYFNYFIDRTSSLEFFFGHGGNGTISLFHQYAHNDWLEFAINQGIMGVILYFVYWLLFGWEWKRYTGPKECKQALGGLIITYFLISLFSMSFNNMPAAATFCIGYCLANANVTERNMI